MVMTVFRRRRSRNSSTAVIKRMGMIKQLKKITLQMMAGANLATIVLMLLIGYSGCLNPVSHPTLANAGLVFPIFLVINFAFLVFWAVFRLRGVIIPLLGFIVCYQPVRTYMPLNISREVPEGAVKVLSYNVWLFAGWDDHGRPNPILSYICQQNADIVCLQESGGQEVGQARIDSALNAVYQYRDSTHSRLGSDVLSVYSKYPILSKDHISYQSVGNHSSAFHLKIGRDTVLLINNHLETTGLSPEEKEQFKSLVKGNLKNGSAKVESKRLIDKLGEASAKRAPEAEAVARYVSQHSNESVILCGDFNDGPLSYVHRTLVRDLTDCYTATGNGPGISYHRAGFYVRIDNIFCSDDWESYGCRVDNKIKSSDHYPIVCWLKKRPKR